LEAFRLMIENDEVSVLEVETIELVACLLGVYDIFVDNEGGALCVVGDTLADLTDGTEFAKELKEFVGADVVVEVLDEKRAVHFRGKFTAATHSLDTGRWDM